jgi:hypothetical protein
MGPQLLAIWEHMGTYLIWENMGTYGNMRFSNPRDVGRSNIFRGAQIMATRFHDASFSPLILLTSSSRFDFATYF